MLVNDFSESNQHPIKIKRNSPFPSPPAHALLTPICLGKSSPAGCYQHSLSTAWADRAAIPQPTRGPGALSVPPTGLKAPCPFDKNFLSIYSMPDIGNGETWRVHSGGQWPWSGARKGTVSQRPLESSSPPCPQQIYPSPPSLLACVSSPDNPHREALVVRSKGGEMPCGLRSRVRLTSLATPGTLRAARANGVQNPASRAFCGAHLTASARPLTHSRRPPGVPGTRCGEMQSARTLVPATRGAF